MNTGGDGGHNDAPPASASPRPGRGAEPRPPKPDVLVAGAGPAGLAAAICAAQRGLTVTVLDPVGAVQHKACGEGLMPAGVAALARMQVQLPKTACWPLAGVAYRSGRRRVQARFGPREVAFGVARNVLSEALRRRASALGVAFVRGRLRALEGSETGVVATTDAGATHANFLVGADGLHSRTRRLAGLEAPAAGGPRRFGLRRHFAQAPYSPFIEVYLGAGQEAYVTPVAADRINVAFLTEDPAAGWDAHVNAFPALRARLTGAPADAVAGAGPFWRPTHGIARGRVALVGDAAGYVDAVTGEGVSLALLAAEAWAAALSATAPDRAYARAMRPARRHYAGHARLLLACLRHRWVVAPALVVLGWFPRLLQAWVRAAVTLPAPASR